MALLHRICVPNDKSETAVYTFIIPESLSQHGTPDIVSRPFSYGGQKWHITFMKTNTHVGAFLHLHNLTDGMFVYIDFGFTFINNEHFTKDESFKIRDCLFSKDDPAKGRLNFIGQQELEIRGFTHERSEKEFIVEVEMKNPRTVFKTWIELPKDPNRDKYFNEAEYPRYETTIFCFGGFDWNISLSPTGDSPQTSGQNVIHITRISGSDQRGILKAKITLGEKNLVLRSGSVNLKCDSSGYSAGVGLGSAQELYNIALPHRKGYSLPVCVDLMEYNRVINVKVALTPDGSKAQQTQLYDTEKQAWTIEADTSGVFLRFKLFYADIQNIPRKYARYVRWILSVMYLSKDFSKQTGIQANGSPCSHYYVQVVYAEPTVISTPIKTAEIFEQGNNFVESGNKINVQIEWIDSMLLYNGNFHVYDERALVFKHQMRKEVVALQAENLLLEKQIHAYQQSMAQKGSRGTTPSATPRAITPNSVTGAFSGMSIAGNQPLAMEVNKNLMVNGSRVVQLDEQNYNRQAEVGQGVTGHEEAYNGIDNSYAQNAQNIMNRNAPITISRHGFDRRLVQPGYQTESHLDPGFIDGNRSRFNDGTEYTYLNQPTQDMPSKMNLVMSNYGTDFRKKGEYF